jgi:hypothetical protein
LNRPAIPVIGRHIRPRPLALQCGQSMIEYVVVCAVLVSALGLGMIDHDSVLWQLIDAFQQAYARFSYAISLPT